MPTYKMTVAPKTKGEEDKVAQALAKISEEDPTVVTQADKETKEMILAGMGEQHLDVVVSKLKNKFNLDVVLSTKSSRADTVSLAMFG